MPAVEWAWIAFGAWDAVAFVSADNQGEIANTAVEINLLDGVGGTSTQILAGI